MTGVAQAVVDKIVRIHHDASMSNSQTTTPTGKREDITLLVRNFNFPLPHALKSPTSQSVCVDSIVQAADNTSIINNSGETNVDSFNPSTNDTSDNTSDTLPNRQLPRDRDAKIKPYVDFTEYFHNFEKRKKEGTLPADIDI